MAPTSAPAQEPYVYQRASTVSTRAVVDEPDKAQAADMAPEYHSPVSHLPRSQMDHSHEHDPSRPPIPSRKSNNYEQALAGRASDTTAASSSAEPRVIAGLAYRGDNADATANRPGMLGRQQSWSNADQKRAQMERMLSHDNAKTSGYTTTAGGIQ